MSIVNPMDVAYLIAAMTHLAAFPDGHARAEPLSPGAKPAEPQYNAVKHSAVKQRVADVPKRNRGALARQIHRRLTDGKYRNYTQ